MKSITLHEYNGITPSLEPIAGNTISFGSGEGEYTVLVKVDGNDTSLNFTVSETMPGFVRVDRVGNIVRIYVKRNYLNNERTGTITFIHKADSSIQTFLNITQEPAVYGIEVNVNGWEYSEGEIVCMSTLLGQNTPSREEFTINIACTGGYEDFEVGKIEEFADFSENTEEWDWRKITFDRGIKVVKANNRKISVINYGIVSMLNEDIMYKITFWHKNNRLLKKSVCFMYDIIKDDGFNVIDNLNDYIVLQSEPVGWSKNYTDYYEFVNGSYVQLKNTVVFEPGRYYAKIMIYSEDNE